MRRIFWLAPLVAACTTSTAQPESPASVGPAKRFVVDDVRLPATTADATAWGGDLNGDGMPDNELGLATALLARQGDLVTDVADQVRSGALAEAVELTFGSGGAVAIAIDGDAPIDATTATTGEITSGAVRPWTPALALPVLVDADPIAFALAAGAIQLIPDGAGGYTAQLQGTVAAAELLPDVAAAVVQMIYAAPRAHFFLAGELDTDRDGAVTIADVEASTVMATVLAPDLANGELSLGIRMHLSPCAAGSCTTAPIADRCEDRVRDGDETGIDCGGSCGPCGAGVACGSDGDCDSQSCAGGRCTAPRCDDGVRDGFETEVDCGGGCGGCATGQTCVVDADCACFADGTCGTGACSADYSAPGVCGG